MPSPSPSSACRPSTWPATAPRVRHRTRCRRRRWRTRRRAPCAPNPCTAGGRRPARRKFAAELRRPIRSRFALEARPRLVTPAGRSAVSDASSAEGRRYARLVRLVRPPPRRRHKRAISGARPGECVRQEAKPRSLPAHAAVAPLSSDCRWDARDAKTEGQRVSGDVLGALLEQLGFRALYLVHDRAAETTHTFALGVTEAAAPVLGTLLLCMESAHFHLVLADRDAVAAAAAHSAHSAHSAHPSYCRSTAQVGTRARLLLSRALQTWSGSCRSKPPARVSGTPPP